MAKKFCVFCGNPPNDKNKEHVLPRWLMALTGDPKRIVRLGFNMGGDKEPSPREFAFDQFTFPACESCNSRHSFLERAAKTVLEKILSRSPVLASEISLMLDWFDKVRVGLWLGFNQLSKNLLDIEPNFHIDRRIGQFDRVLIIERSAPLTQRLSFIGVDSPAFGITPSAFALSVNGVLFTNISYSFLVSRRLGFPYPSESNLDRDREGLWHAMQPARERIMRPIIQRPMRERGVTLFQPMFPQKLAEEPSEYFENSYVRAHSLDHEVGVGSIFFENIDEPARLLSNGESLIIDPPSFYQPEELLIRGIINICDWQDWLTDGTFGLGNLTPEQRRYVRSKQSMTRRVNKIFRDHHLSILRQRGYVT